MPIRTKCLRCSQEFDFSPSDKRKYCSNQCRWASQKLDVLFRFWSWVIKTDDCWVFSCAPNGDGYCFLLIEGKTVPAHRLSWLIHRGPIPEGLCILHKCDNRQCVRPDHLFPGTNADNSADMVIKGRQARGERSPRSKLSEPEVLQIRARRLAGETLKVVAADYGVDFSTISDIDRRKTWKHVA